jgi:hypothetical protein
LKHANENLTDHEPIFAPALPPLPSSNSHTLIVMASNRDDRGFLTARAPACGRTPSPTALVQPTYRDDCGGGEKPGALRRMAADFCGEMRDVQPALTAAQKLMKGYFPNADITAAVFECKRATIPSEDALDRAGTIGCERLCARVVWPAIVLTKYWEEGIRSAMDYTVRAAASSMSVAEFASHASEPCFFVRAVDPDGMIDAKYTANVFETPALAADIADNRARPGDVPTMLECTRSCS